MRDITNLFEKRDIKATYKGSKRALKDLVFALTDFDYIQNKILETYTADSQRIIDLANSTDIKTTNTKLLKAIINLEDTNKNKLINILEDELQNESKLDILLKTKITDRESSLHYASCLGKIDDYIDILIHGEV